MTLLILAVLWPATALRWPGGPALAAASGGQDPVDAVRKFLETGDEAAAKAAGEDIAVVEKAVRAAMSRGALLRAGIE